ncbi:hypothetical protein LY76DRAFT_39358 [Colletotrichum caudatum]|nr:hypothetical protein LY76DRAFT_39358 [Colletotrichum caudatum]
MLRTGHKSDTHHPVLREGVFSPFDSNLTGPSSQSIGRCICRVGILFPYIFSLFPGVGYMVCDREARQDARTSYYPYLTSFSFSLSLHCSHAMAPTGSVLGPPSLQIVPMGPVAAAFSTDPHHPKPKSPTTDPFRYVLPPVLDRGLGSPFLSSDPISTVYTYEYTHVHRITSVHHQVSLPLLCTPFEVQGDPEQGTSSSPSPNIFSRAIDATLPLPPGANPPARGVGFVVVAGVGFRRGWAAYL